MSAASTFRRLQSDTSRTLLGYERTINDIAEPTLVTQSGHYDALKVRVKKRLQISLNRDVKITIGPILRDRGLAYSRVELSGNTTVNGSIVGTSLPPFSGATAFSELKTTAGFAVGGGFEAKLRANWTWKIEYLYLDLGCLDTVSPFPAATPVAGGFSTPFTGSMTTHTHFTDNIVRVGLNYKFGNY